MQGCWTCRVRRKRCEDISGRCATCTRLGLACDGYGPKPHWVDGGDRERLRRQELKTAIKLRLHRRHANRNSTGNPHYNSNPATHGPETHGYSTGDLWTWLPQDDSHTPALPTPTSTIHSASISSLDQELISGSNISLDMTPIRPPTWQLEHISSPNLQLHSGANSNDGADDRPHTGVGQDSNPTENVRSAHGNDGESAIRAAGELTSVTEFQWQVNDVLNYTTSLDLPWQLAGSNRGANAKNVMIYLDHIFDLQFPFHDTVDGYDTGRGWVLTLLADSATFLCLTFALATLHLSTCAKLPRDVRTMHDVASQKYHGLGLKQLQADINRAGQRLSNSNFGHHQLRMRTEMLACTVHLVHLSCIRGSFDQARLHLRAAHDLMLMISRDLPALHNTQQLDHDQRLNEEYTHQSSNVEFINTSLAHLTSSLLRQDALVATNFHDGPVFSEKVTTWIVQEFGSSLSPLTDLMVLLSKSARLDCWKAECARQRRLSHFALIEKASEIQASVLKCCKDSDHNSASTNASCSSLSHTVSPAQTISQLCRHCQNCSANPSKSFWPQGREREMSQVTRAYAHAVLIHLHVIISGPWAPEMTTNVAPIIHVLQCLMLRNPKALAHMAWPLYTAGCYAKEEQRRFFTNLKDQIAPARGEEPVRRQIMAILENIFKVWDAWDAFVKDKAGGTEMASPSNEITEQGFKSCFGV